jgi:hypothetical protein
MQYFTYRTIIIYKCILFIGNEMNRLSYYNVKC